jgi:hypothetical protein
MSTIKIDPHPLSYTANGGNNTDRTTLQTLINPSFLILIGQRYQLIIAENISFLFFVSEKLVTYVLD